MLHQITILGSTGSVGISTLDVVERNADKYQVFALTANQNVDLLVKQCQRFKPRYAVIADNHRLLDLQQKLKQQAFKGEVLSGADALAFVAEQPEVDSVMAAIVGAAGLLPSIAAARAGKRILLANKEALVMAGPLFMQAVRDNNATLLPIDSEHNALFQCLPTDKPYQGVTKLVLTASGGPFRDMSPDDLKNVTPEQACAHPTWNMGRKISVDSASMMNKALEVIEAHYLFNIPPENIEVVIHPQSIIHSMVQYVDGSVLSQMGNPDMRTPIAHALAYPERIVSGVDALQLAGKSLTFRELDNAQYPCLALAYRALELGGTAPTIMNAANEVAVEAFLQGRLAFSDIFMIVASTLDAQKASNIAALSDVLAADAQARNYAVQKIDQSI